MRKKLRTSPKRTRLVSRDMLSRDILLRDIFAALAAFLTLVMMPERSFAQNTTPAESPKGVEILLLGTQGGPGTLRAAIGTGHHADRRWATVSDRLRHRHDAADAERRRESQMVRTISSPTIIQITRSGSSMYWLTTFKALTSVCQETGRNSISTDRQKRLRS